MDNKAAIEMMQRCREEIRHQRMMIDHLTPKAQAWDQICKVLNMLPQPQQGFAEDIVWRLDKQIEELKTAMTKPDPTAIMADDAGGGA
ncbi:MAG: hypothetical protein LCH61_12015 [Proteobacteria bacterium]|nr:hypothetical protein [Pseudomonadota bacterium]